MAAEKITKRRTEFVRFKPRITKFRTGEEDFGGHFDALGDKLKKPNSCEKSRRLAVGSVLGLLTANGCREVKIIAHDFAHSKGHAETPPATQDRFHLVNRAEK